MKKLLSILMLCLFATLSPAAPIGQDLQNGQNGQNGKDATLEGRVTDAKTGEPIAKVKVIIIGSGRSATTDRSGQFLLQNLAPGESELYITTIGYGLLKKRITLKPGEKNELQISLHQEAAQRLDEVTVTAGPFQQTQTNAASEHSLNKQELQSLSMLLIADPVRALQALPGVSGNDDFRSEFVLRGAGFRRVGFFIDGLFLPENPAHTAYGHDNAGQISILNTDTMASATLLSGAFPSRFGDGTAGLLNLETRDGNRIKPAGRIAGGLLSSSATFDGPLPGKGGAWLVSARKSYLQYLINALTNDEGRFDGIAVDFTDAQAKAVYDLTSHHQIGINAIVGWTDFDPKNSKLVFDEDEVANSHSRNSFAYLSWNYTAGPRFAAQTKFFNILTDYTNADVDHRPLQEGKVLHRGVRSDLNFTFHPDHRMEGGIYLREVRGSGNEITYRSNPPVSLSNYDRSSNQQGYYLQDTWSNKRLALALTAGARIDRFGLTDETVVMPRAALSFAPFENTRIRLGWGQYGEFPEFMHLYGSRGTQNLRAERATHYNVSIEQLIGSNTRILIEGYDREDKSLLFSMNDFLRRDGVQTFIDFPFRNSLKGYARGFELSLHRRSANRLTGWLAYSYTKTRLIDDVTGLRFVSDYDQRHTISAYGSYRLTNTFNLSGQWRYGSGMPMIGSSNDLNHQFTVLSERNSVRLPVYSRLDLRASKAFYFKRSKLTILGELINALGRDNFRQNGRRVDKLLPLLPSIGISFEF